MVFDQAPPDGVMEWASSGELDWDALYADQLPRVLNYFRFRLGQHADAEELTSLTFEKAWRARQRYRKDLAGFSTWLFKIARNVGSDHLRSRRRLVPIDAAMERAAEGTPLDDAERDSNLARLTELSAHLPEKERELIALKYGAGMDHHAIARLTGLSESNIGVILHRTVQTLRARW
jgi:RNA polymerase sigma-70 factor (ECF subfamily)